MASSCGDVGALPGAGAGHGGVVVTAFMVAAFGLVAAMTVALAIAVVDQWLTDHPADQRKRGRS